MSANPIERFHLIEDGACILFSRGVYRQAKVYHRGRDVFAGWGGGFVKIGPSNGTSNPNVGWRDIEADGVECSRVGGQPKFVGATDRSEA